MQMKSSTSGIAMQSIHTLGSIRSTVILHTDH
jgi:hypothetical protein